MPQIDVLHRLNIEPDGDDYCGECGHRDPDGKMNEWHGGYCTVFSQYLATPRDKAKSGIRCDECLNHEANPTQVHYLPPPFPTHT